MTIKRLAFSTLIFLFTILFIVILENSTLIHQEYVIPPNFEGFPFNKAAIPIEGIRKMHGVEVPTGDPIYSDSNQTSTTSEPYEWNTYVWYENEEHPNIGDKSGVFTVTKLTKQSIFYKGTVTVKAKIFYEDMFEVYCFDVDPEYLKFLPEFHPGDQRSTFCPFYESIPIVNEYADIKDSLYVTIDSYDKIMIGASLSNAANVVKISRGN